MASPGWYNDESDPTLARWHDGADWTEHVVVKREWEAAGHPPPPPEELFVGADPVRRGRIRAVGGAAVVALAVLVGVALADEGGDPGPEKSPAARGSDDRDRADVVDQRSFTDLTDDTTAEVDPSAEVDSTDDAGRAASTGPTSARSGTTRTTARATSSGGVQRTEELTRTRTDPGPVSQVNGRDQTDIGNTTNTSIRYEYVPPPPSEEPPPEDPPTDSTAPPDTEPDAPEEGGP